MAPQSNIHSWRLRNNILKAHFCADNEIGIIIENTHKVFIFKPWQFQCYKEKNLDRFLFMWKCNHWPEDQLPGHLFMNASKHFLYCSNVMLLFSYCADCFSSKISFFPSWKRKESNTFRAADDEYDRVPSRLPGKGNITIRYIWVNFIGFSKSFIPHPIFVCF